MERQRWILAKEDWDDLPPVGNIHEYVNDRTRRIDEVFEQPGYFAWTDTAWAAMLMRQGILPKEHIPQIIQGILEFWSNPSLRSADLGPKQRFGALERYVMREYGSEVGGNLTTGRTIPPYAWMMMPVRHKLMKLICCLQDFQDVLLDTAEKHLETVMPGYTHIRHAQPTTFGHYLLSIFDPLARIMKTVEDGYHAMSLSELGCGALAGTDLPIDRNLVADYLGLEGLIENSNDAVSYTDGYVLLVSALANLMAVLSRPGRELGFWSGLEYGFLQFPFESLSDRQSLRYPDSRARSHFMPQKTTSASQLESLCIGASKVSGALVEVLTMGMKAPHGDMVEMMGVSDGTLRAIDEVQRHAEVFIHVLPRLTVFEENMLAMARMGYSSSTELAEHIALQYGLGQRTAHEIVNKFVLYSQMENTPAYEARVELLEETAQEMIGRRLGISEQDLRRLLDPVEFVKNATSQGGVAPTETARMVKERRKWMAEAHDRHMKRIEMLESSKATLLADLEKIGQENSEA